MANILQQFGRFLSGAFSTANINTNTQKVNQQVRENYIPYGGFAVYPDNKASTYIEFYETNENVYSVLTLIAKKFATIPTYFYRVDDQAASKALQMSRKSLPLHRWKKLQTKAYNEEEEDNVISQLVNNPNKTQSKELFEMLACLSFLDQGETFIWLNRGLTYEDMADYSDEDIASMPVLEMWVLPAQFVQLMPGEWWWDVREYRLEVMGRFWYIRKPDIIHWKMPTLQFDGLTRPQSRGLSPLKAGLRTVTASNALTDAQVAMAQNDGAKGVLYNELNTNPEPGAADKIRSTIDGRINSRDMAGAVATLQGKWGYLDLSSSGKDMELNQALQARLVTICNLYGISPNLFIQGTTFENLSQARRDLITNCIMFLRDGYNGEVKRGLAPTVKFTYKWTIDSDYTCLPEMQEDQAKQAETLSKCWWFTPNQRLEQMNEETSSDPNMDKVYIPTTLTPLDDLNVIVDDYSNPMAATNGQPASVNVRL